MLPISPPIKLSAAEKRAIKYLVKANELSCSDMQINMRTTAESNIYKRMRRAGQMCLLDLQRKQTHRLNKMHAREAIYCNGTRERCATLNRGFSVGINEWKWLWIELGVNTALSWLLPHTRKQTWTHTHSTRFSAAPTEMHVHKRL